jgi:hypothetical protein
MFECPPTKAHASMVKSGKTHKSFSLLNIVKKASLNKSRVFKSRLKNFKNSGVKCNLDKASLKMVKGYYCRCWLALDFLKGTYTLYLFFIDDPMPFTTCVPLSLCCNKL